MPSGKGQKQEEFAYSGPMLASLPLGVVVQDGEGRITHANPCACRILGLTLDQMRGVTSIDPRWQAVHEDTSPMPGEEHPAMVALRTGVPVVHARMGVTHAATAQQTWIEVTATPVWNAAHDKVQAVYTVFEDITERRQMQAALLEKQMQYRLAVETSTDGFMALDASGNVVEVNSAYSTLSGYSREELLHMAIMDLQTKENAAETQARIDASMRWGHAMFETLHRAKDGTLWPVEVSLNYSATEGGRFFAFFRDIRRRHQYEAQARQFEAIVQSSHDAIVASSLDGTVTSWNPAAQSLFGYSAEEMIGKPLRVLFPPDRALEEDDMLARIKRGEHVQNFDTVRLRQDGTSINVSVSIAPIRNVQGQIIGASKIARDITERKETELRINFLAFHDQLTGLPNRTLFFDRFSQAISMAKRNERKVALLFLDLDGFKPVNDRYGHDAGDIVLKIVADRLLSAVRAMDTVARLGGDEFAIILGQLEVSEEARHVAGKLLGTVAQAISIREDTEVGVRASIGVAIYPDNGSEMDVLLGKADKAMYQSKDTGRDKFTFWDNELTPPTAQENWMQVGDAHRVGFAEMDEQHRHLVDLTNTLNRSIQAAKGSDEINREFDNLIEYTKFHFATEHAWMERYSYPGMKLHDAAHNRLLMDASHFKPMLNRGGDLFVLQSIKDWLLNHIQTEDKVLGAFLKKH